MNLSKKSQCGRRYKGDSSASVSVLKRKLDRIFSEYIRLRDSENGYSRCITCGKVMPWKNKNTHCGHFRNRAALSTRYHEKNCHAQCINCNSFAEGEQFLYGKAIDKIYGEGTADNLTVLSKIKTKATPMWYEQMIDDYKNKLKAMKKEKL